MRILSILLGAAVVALLASPTVLARDDQTDHVHAACLRACVPPTVAESRKYHCKKFVKVRQKSAQ